MALLAPNTPPCKTKQSYLLKMKDFFLNVFGNKNLEKYNFIFKPTKMTHDLNSKLTGAIFPP